MAAGQGTRLRPITEPWPKPILPIDGRPVIATLLRQLKDEGLGPVTVVTGYLAEHVEELLRGLEIRFASQPEPDGSADAVDRALARFAETFSASGAAGAIAYFRGSGPVAIRVEDGHVRRVVDSEPGELAPAPL